MGEFLYLGHAHAYWLSDGQLWLCPRQHWLLRHCQGQGVHQDQFRFGLPNHLWFWFICNCIYFVDFDNFWFSFQQFWTILSITGILLIFVEKGSRKNVSSLPTLERPLALFSSPQSTLHIFRLLSVRSFDGTASDNGSAISNLGGG